MRIFMLYYHDCSPDVLHLVPKLRTSANVTLLLPSALHCGQENIYFFFMARLSDRLCNILAKTVGAKTIGEGVVGLACVLYSSSYSASA